MKALTIMEPWAWCIINLSEQSDRWKCVENRGERFPRYTGPLLIHSGQGAAWLKHEETISDHISHWTGCALPCFERIVGRGIIGAVRVIGACDMDGLRIVSQMHGIDYETARLWASGPRCLLLARPFVFPRPIVWPGRQGLWDMPDELLFEAFDSETWRKFETWRGDARR